VDGGEEGEEGVDCMRAGKGGEEEEGDELQREDESGEGQPRCVCIHRSERDDKWGKESICASIRSRSLVPPSL